MPELLTALEYLTKYEYGLLSISIDPYLIAAYLQRAMHSRWFHVDWIPRELRISGDVAYPKELWAYFLEVDWRDEDVGQHSSGARGSSGQAEGSTP
ncbi:MAG: hypothetical protein ACWGQW_00260 [bacterium]